MKTTQLWHAYPPTHSDKNHTTTGDIRVMQHVAGFGLKPRDVYVYLPPQHDKGTQQFPVLYMQDGQNAFDAATSFAGEWGADEAAEKLATKKRGCIIVAIANTPDRTREYAPYSRTHAKHGTLNALGDTYLDFVVKHIKPMIDRDFHTLPDAAHTGIAGSSLGGLIALYATLTRADVFGFCAALSPAIWFSFGRLFDLANRAPNESQRIYMDMGAKEGTHMVSDTQRMAQLLHTRDFDVAFRLDARGTHNERSWARRFPAALPWFVGAGRKPR